MQRQTPGLDRDGYCERDWFRRQGYVPKKASGSDLLKAIRTVANEGSYLSPHISHHLFQRIKKAGPQSSPATSALEVLAPRELQVFWLVAAGNASKDSL
ncbi:MAG: hypothetical protein ABSE57_19285 [Bryobacteraceae bacterium]|jgi:two-component system response regulator NreC